MAKQVLSSQELNKKFSEAKEQGDKMYASINQIKEDITKKLSILGYVINRKLQERIAPTEKNTLIAIIQNDLNFAGITSTRLFIVIGIIAPNENPIILLVSSKITTLLI